MVIFHTVHLWFDRHSDLSSKKWTDKMSKGMASHCARFRQWRRITSGSCITIIRVRSESGTELSRFATASRRLRWRDTFGYNCSMSSKAIQTGKNIWASLCNFSALDFPHWAGVISDYYLGLPWSDDPGCGKQDSDLHTIRKLKLRYGDYSYLILYHPILYQSRSDALVHLK